MTMNDKEKTLLYQKIKNIHLFKSELNALNCSIQNRDLESCCKILETANEYLKEKSCKNYKFYQQQNQLDKELNRLVDIQSNEFDFLIIANLKLNSPSFVQIDEKNGKFYSNCPIICRTTLKYINIFYRQLQEKKEKEENLNDFILVFLLV